MSFDSDLDRLVGRIESAAFDVLDEYGGRIEDELAETLNAPYPPASVEGETPHRRTGRLRAGLYHVTTADGDRIITRIISTRPGEYADVPGVLNFTLNRPYMTNLYDALQTRFEPEITSLLINRVNSL